MSVLARPYVLVSCNRRRVGNIVYGNVNPYEHNADCIEKETRQILKDIEKRIDE